MSKISPVQLAEYVVNQIESGKDVGVVSKMIAGYLVDARQTRESSKVMRAIEAELNKRGTTQVEITSAHQISDETKKQLAELLDAKNPVFSENIDPSVIGGVKAKAGEKQVDLTVRGRLNRFKAKVVN